MVILILVALICLFYENSLLTEFGISLIYIFCHLSATFTVLYTQSYMIPSYMVYFSLWKCKSTWKSSCSSKSLNTLSLYIFIYFIGIAFKFFTYRCDEINLIFRNLHYIRCFHKSIHRLEYTVLCIGSK